MKGSSLVSVCLIFCIAISLAACGSVEDKITECVVGEVTEKTSGDHGTDGKETDNEGDKSVEHVHRILEELNLTDYGENGNVRASSKVEVLKIAEKYHQYSYPNIEQDLRDEYSKLVDWKVNFAGENDDIQLAAAHSFNVATVISYTNAKNLYLALASAVFSLNPDNVSSACNLATAIATYYDDLVLEGKEIVLGKNDFYNDALCVYQYGIVSALKTGDNLEQVIPLLTCLGNLYLDVDRYEEALVAFKTALDIDSTCWPARKGLYNLYMVQEEFEEALKLLSEKENLPVFAKSIATISKDFEEKTIEDEPPSMDQPDEVFESELNNLKKVEPVTTADFITDIDQNTRNKIKGLVENIATKMVYKAPDIKLVSQYASLKAFSEPLGQSALAEFASGVSAFVVNEANESAQAHLEQLEGMGIDIDINVDIQDIMKNPEKYENFDPNISLPSEAEIEKKAKEYMESMSGYAESMAAAIGKAEHGDPSNLYSEMSKMSPEYKIFSINPYTYTNYIDLLIQRYNISVLNRKFTTYQQYLARVNDRVFDSVNELVMNMITKLQPYEAMEEAEIEQIKKRNLGYHEEIIAIHKVHVKYNAVKNNIMDVTWNQATSIASVAYTQKIKPYAEQMYNDCVKHIMLLSDSNVQEHLEEELKREVLSNIGRGLQNVLTAYSCANYEEHFECDCDIKELNEAREAIRAKEDALALEQAKKNKAARERFEKCEIDENSEYYKKFIKPYEVTINTPFFEGKVGPYKSYWKVKFDLPVNDNYPNLSLSFGAMQNRYRNTTTYDGGMSISAGPAKAYMNFTALRNEDGHFSPDDIDIVGGGELSAQVGSLTGSVSYEASALRGSRLSTQIAVTGNQVFDELKVKDMLGWSPDATKVLWTGEYKVE